MKDDKKEPTQKTPKGYEIPVPTEVEFEQLVKKAATPVTPKEPSREGSSKK
ncbi:MAG: hypothetical protein HYY02_01055 [Chloroflexi bacterium]|nr:hypothetical protein [Chloroflexota bacterium]